MTPWYICFVTATAGAGTLRHVTRRVTCSLAVPAACSNASALRCRPALAFSQESPEHGACAERDRAGDAELDFSACARGTPNVHLPADPLGALANSTQTVLAGAQPHLVWRFSAPAARRVPKGIGM